MDGARVRGGAEQCFDALRVVYTPSGHVRRVRRVRPGVIPLGWAILDALGRIRSVRRFRPLGIYWLVRVYGGHIRRVGRVLWEVTVEEVAEL